MERTNTLYCTIVSLTLPLFPPFFRYELFIIGEHEFKVEHSLMALPGVKKADIKRVLSHPQALAQCDNYLRNLG